jgi:cell division protein FtsW (lipid II flippase)
MHTLLYAIWFMLPLFFFGLALWSKLEKMSGQNKRDNVGDFVRQGFFVSLCVALAVLIDQFMLKDVAESIYPELLPLGLYQVLLLPFILYIGAMLIGPTKDLKVNPYRHRQKAAPPKKRRR